MVKDIVYFQNTVTFKIDRSFDIEYPNRKYGIFLDLTADAASGKPAVAFFTFKNGEFIHNFIRGVNKAPNQRQIVVIQF